MNLMSLLNLAKSLQATPPSLDVGALMALSASLEDLANTHQPEDAEGHLWKTLRFVERLIAPRKDMSRTHLLTPEYHFSKNVKPGAPIPQRRRSDENRVVPTVSLHNFINETAEVTEGIFEFAI